MHPSGSARRLLQPSLGIALGTLVFATLIARDASAYVCTPVKNNGGLTQAWDQRCIPYTIDRRGNLFAGPERRMLIAQSFRVWSGNACTDLEFMDMGYTNQGPKFDPSNPGSNENVIVSIETADDLKYFPQTGLLAITLTSYSTETGEIFDADILFNAVDFKFEDVTSSASCQSGTRAYDLRNTLIHEMGHLIGFDHTPDGESTMYASATQCETKKRDLTDDDRLGVCTVYPKGQPTKTCAPPDDYDKNAAAIRFRCQCERLSGESTDACAGDSTGCMCVTGEPDESPSWAGAEGEAPKRGRAGVSVAAGGLAIAALVWARRRRR